MKRLSLLQLLQQRYPSNQKKELFSAILCGDIYVNNERIRDPKKEIPINSIIRFQPKKYVSRGGDKLEAALKKKNISVKNKVFLDAGSSTGGFTDCLIQFGASKVHAVDVGKNQMDFSLRKDSRVILHEQQNIMQVKKLEPQPHAFVADVSFRSITSVAYHLLLLTKEHWGIVLIKPQFEWRNPGALFNGVVREREHLIEIISHVLEQLKKQSIEVIDLTLSPIKGRKGNVELFFYISLQKGEVPQKNQITSETVREVIQSISLPNGFPTKGDSASK